MIDPGGPVGSNVHLELFGLAEGDLFVRIAGPPGCGKTEFVSRQCRRAAEAFGNERVLVLSLTRAAAETAAGRNSVLPKSATATLHAHCRRNLGHPKIVGAKDIEAWNQENPDLLVAEDGGDADGPIGSEARRQGTARGDVLIRRSELLRHQRIPIERWPNDVLAFHARWSAWKREAELFDFTDLLERGLTDLERAPGNPAVIFGDEAQDFSRLELAVLEAWSAHCQKVVLVGDRDQALYVWRGAAQEVMSGKLHKVLDRSYRVPRAVRDYALRVAKAGGGWNEATSYEPRLDLDTGEEVKGSVEVMHGLNTRRPEGVLPLAEEAEKAGEQLMILATCDYMLSPTKRVLAKAGIPWHNPFSDRYNPIGERARSTVEALTALSRNTKRAGWTVSELRLFAEALRSVPAKAGAEEGVRRGGKVALASAPEGLPPAETWALAVRWFTPGALAALEAGDIAWLLRHNASGNPNPSGDGDRFGVGPLGGPLELALRTADRSGVEALRSRPTVILGTIHSVKGGEAERVLLFPELSPGAYRQLRTPGWEGREAVFRVFYVGATRASSKLYLAEGASAMSVPLARL